MPIRSRCLDSSPFVDQVYSVSVSSTTTSSSLLNELASATGLLQQYPQHADPVYEAGIGFRLRQTLHLKFMELDFQAVGSQGNALVSGDLFNTMRVAVFLVGETYLSANLNYLTSIVQTDIRDVKHVYLDHLMDLPSQAYDTVSTTNVPQVITKQLLIPINKRISFYSTSASGGGATWESREDDIVVNVVSDSGVVPNPTFNSVFRLWFEFVNGRN